jgi:type II secretory pathway component PulC
MKEMTFLKVNFSRIKYNLSEYRFLPYFALILASIYLIYVLFTFSYDAKSTSQFQSSILESEQITQEYTPIKQIDFLLIKDWHMFGHPSATMEQNNQLNAKPQETELQIKLLGVFFLPNQKKSSFAIIEGDDKLQKKYRLGEELPGGVTLQSIDKEQVILLRNQQPEYLSMDKTKTGLLFITK